MNRNQKGGKGWFGALLPMLIALLTLLPLMAWAGPYEDANALYKAGDYKSALTLLQQAQRETPDDPRVFAGLGKTYRKLGDNASALKAYTEVVRLDPNLTSIGDKSGFLSVFRSLGGKVPAPQPNPAGKPGQSEIERMRGNNPNLLINALSSDDVVVSPGMMSLVDKAAVQAAVEAARPTQVKVLAVGRTGNFPSREALADDLRKRLDMPRDGVLIVATPKGVSASSARLNRKQMAAAFQKAGVDVAYGKGGLTAAIIASVQAVTGKVVSEQRQTTNTAAGVIGLGLLGGGGFLAYRAYRKRKALADVVEPLEQERRKVLEHLSYADGYLDLLPKGADGDEAKRLRASAFEKYDTATGILKSAKTPDDARKAGPLLEQSEAEMISCRQAIDKATGGTGVVMGLSTVPDISTTETKAQRFIKTENLRTEEDRRQMQAELDSIPANERGVSFFSGQPLPSSELVPVTIVVQGKKRTVMASREEAATIARGETPEVRAFRDDSGQYVPWYEYRSYDPYRDYYGNRGLFSGSDFVSLYLLSQLMGPGMYGGYGPWGYGGYGWGMPVPPPTWGGWGWGGGYTSGDYYGAGGAYGGYQGSQDGGNYGGAPQYDATPDNAGGMDFFGSTYNEQGGNFDDVSTDSGSSFDFGGSDSGGGADFGGGDFGGGGDW